MRREFRSSELGDSCGISGDFTEFKDDSWAGMYLELMKQTIVVGFPVNALVGALAFFILPKPPLMGSTQ